ncbi:MAG TPA: glycosyltransferase [Steroidobacteraceae bacterium]|nr:glycosyltransferase [Steroidobacteraceae bacterium]
MKRVLLIAYHFPPAKGSSGLQRALKFCRYLPEFGWLPSVLTVAPRAHPQTASDQLAEIPAGVEVKRAFALDAARHLSIKGIYPSWAARPDRWGSWWLGGVPAGRAMLRRLKIDAIWSTFPIATAHLIGHTLAKSTGLPWIADFRDSMTEDAYPRDANVRRRLRKLEARTVARAAASVFTTPGALRMYRERYPHVPPERFQVIANGFDEENFGGARAPVSAPHAGGPRVLLHSGLLYPVERDPRALFAALAELKQAGEVDAGRLQVVLRATGHDAEIAQLLGIAAIEDLVKIAPPIAYEAALAEMLAADALLLLQAANCNHQIPAKLYEYLRCGRPILALTDPAGDTANELRAAQAGTIVPLDRADLIRDRLRALLGDLDRGAARGADPAIAARFSRRSQTSQLAALLDATRPA